MKISELEKREDFDELVDLGRRYRGALDEYQHSSLELGEKLNIYGRDVGTVARQLDNWYVKHDCLLPSEVE